MGLVALSLLALAVGPLLSRALSARASWASWLDAFVLVCVAGLVAVHVVPQSVALGGAWSLLACVLGLALPLVLHKLEHQIGHDAHAPHDDVTPPRARPALLLSALVLGGVLVHAMLDGLALSDRPSSIVVDDDHAGGVSMLALAVLLHRVPVGLALWSVVRPRVGLVRMLVVAGTYGGGTVLGYLWGDRLVTADTVAGFAWLQAFLAGTILHVVVDAPADPKSVAQHPRASAVGALSAVALLLVLTHRDGHVGEGELGPMVLMTSPFVVLVLLALGVRAWMLTTSPRTMARQWHDAWRASLVRGVDRIMPWWVLALVVAMQVEPALPAQVARVLHPTDVGTPMYTVSCDVLVVLLVASLFRTGTRGFVARITGGVDEGLDARLIPHDPRDDDEPHAHGAHEHHHHD